MGDSEGDGHGDVRWVWRGSMQRAMRLLRTCSGVSTRFLGGSGSGYVTRSLEGDGGGRAGPAAPPSSAPFSFAFSFSARALFMKCSILGDTRSGTTADGGRSWLKTPASAREQ